MGLFQSLRRIDAPEPGADYRAIVSRYKRLRAVSIDLNNKLVERLPSDVIDEGGRKLGMIRGKALFFESESALSVLMDYCLYDVRRRGVNAIEQYLIDSPPDPESDEMEYLRAMQHARYSMVLVESVIRGVGVKVCDILAQEQLLLVDMGFARTGVPGALLAARLLYPDGFTMTSGAGLPIGVVRESKREEATADLTRSVVCDPDGNFDPAPLIRRCLQDGCAGQIQYQDPTGRIIGPTTGPTHFASTGPPRRFNKNSPCACGSGRKYKQCCMKRIAKRP